MISVAFLCPSNETFNGAPCQAQANNPIHLITQEVVLLVFEDESAPLGPPMKFQNLKHCQF